MFQTMICCVSFGKTLTFSVHRCKTKAFPEVVIYIKKKNGLLCDEMDRYKWYSAELKFSKPKFAEKVILRSVSSIQITLY